MRTLAFNLMNVYAIKMAGVFMISTHRRDLCRLRRATSPGLVALALLILFGSHI